MKNLIREKRQQLRNELLLRLRNWWRGQERELTLEKIEIRPFNVDNHAIAIYIHNRTFTSPLRAFEQMLLLCKKNRWSHIYVYIYIYIYVRRRCIISNVSASKAYYYFLVPWREKGNVTRRNIEAGAYDDTPGSRTQSRCCRLRHSEGGWTCKSRDRRATFDSQMPARWVAAVIACNFCYRLRIEVSVLFFLFFPFSFLFFSSFFSFLFFFESKN